MSEITEYTKDFYDKIYTKKELELIQRWSSDPDEIYEALCSEEASVHRELSEQILHLIKRLITEKGISLLLITHDLGIVADTCDWVFVMYAGKIVELSERSDLFSSPLHPYTQALLSAVPIPDPKKDRLRQRIMLSGDVPSPINPPKGCRFHPRCPYAQSVCSEREPQLEEIKTNHRAACFFPRK